MALWDAAVEGCYGSRRSMRSMKNSTTCLELTCRCCIREASSEAESHSIQVTFGCSSDR